MARRRVRQVTVSVVSLEAPTMVTVDADDLDDLDERVAGAFVRLRPTPGMAPDALAALKTRIAGAGALAVRSTPIPTVEQAVEALPDLPNVADRSMRAVVMDRFERARNLDDRDAVEAALNEALDAARL